MADISWNAYALAMFTEEQRAAAVAATILPENEPLIIRPPDNPITRGTFGIRVEGLNPNDPRELAEITRRGYIFVNGEWRKGTLGTVVNPEAQANAPGFGRVGLSSVPSQTVIGGGSVLGFSVPLAPAVLLPSFVGGRIGRVSIGEGLRPEAGGGERVRFGRFPEVRGLRL